MLGAASVSLVWEPVLGPALLAALVGGAAVSAVVAVVAWRATRYRVWWALGLRLGAVAALGVAAAGPSLRWAGAEAARGRVVVLLDSSASMGLCAGDARNGATRLEELRDGWLSAPGLAALSAHADVELAAFDEGAATVTIEAARQARPTGEVTALARALDGAVRGLGEADRPGSSGVREVVILSDGVETAGGDVRRSAEAARLAGVRVHAVLPDAGAELPDVAARVRAGRSVIEEGERLRVVLDVRQSGFAGRALQAVLREGGRDGPVVARAELAVADEAQRVTLEHTPAGPAGSGIRLAELWAGIEPLDAERQRENNGEAVFVQVCARRLRVLMIDAAPSWDSRVVSQALAGAAGVELDHVSRVVRRRAGAEASRGLRGASFEAWPGEKVESGSGPTDPRGLLERIEEADIVIVTSLAGLTREEGDLAARLEAFVRGGGAVLLMDAREAAELREPERARAAAPEQAEAVRQLAAWCPVLPAETDASLEGPEPCGFVDAAFSSERVEPGAEVIEVDLGDGAALAVAAVQGAGAGRVAGLGVRDVWRWRMATCGESDESGLAESRLWVFDRGVVELVARAAGEGRGAWDDQWLVFSERTHATLGERVTVFVAAPAIEARGAGVRAPELTVRGVAGVSRVALVPVAGAGVAAGAGAENSAGRWQAQIVAGHEGLLSVELEEGPSAAATRAVVVVRPDARETWDQRPRERLMREVCAGTGGEVWRAGDVEEFARGLAERAAALAEPGRVEPLWERWPVALALLAMLLAEWRLRRKAGLP